MTESDELYEKLAALGPAVPVSGPPTEDDIERLVAIGQAAYEAEWEKWDSITAREHWAIRARVRAIRAAIGSAVPVRVTDAMVDAAMRRYVAYGPETARARMRAALNAAIEAAKESDL